jgi:hypothetical protein
MFIAGSPASYSTLLMFITPCTGPPTPYFKHGQTNVTRDTTPKPYDIYAYFTPGMLLHDKGQTKEDPHPHACSHCDNMCWRVLECRTPHTDLHPHSANSQTNTQADPYFPTDKTDVHVQKPTNIHSTTDQHAGRQTSTFPHVQTGLQAWRIGSQAISLLSCKLHQCVYACTYPC